MKACLKKKKMQLWVVSHPGGAQESFVRPCVLILGTENVVTIIISLGKQRVLKILCRRGVIIR